MEIEGAGRLILSAAAAAAVWATVGSLVGIRRRDERMLSSGRRALYATATLAAAATVLLAAALAAHDFSIAYVAAYTSRSTPFPYVLTALWAGMEGSLLFWAFLTAIYAVTAIVAASRRATPLTPIATSVLGGILAFFLGLLAFAANPFAGSSPIPPDGSGLNPLLQSPFMTIHPVLLYLGLTGFTVPFAFAVASLVRGRLDVSWFTATRRWTVLAWSFLSVGIILGGAWAYMELGWGGYWAWDPVENASLLPWLTGTAFLHSVMVQERRGMLKTWNVALILATYSLAIFGTFLTRSGLLQSVHTFSESPLGRWFLPLLGMVLIGSFALLAWRFDRLRSDRHLDSLLSREAMFLFNNLLFAAIAFAVLWGTLYPVLAEALRGRKISVGPPYFNGVVAPLGLALLGLTGIGPLVAWRRASAASLRRQLAGPLAVGSAATLALAVAGLRSVGALLALGLCVFVAAAIGSEFVRGTQAHRRAERTGWLRAFRRLVGRNRRRYGGYIVHLGVVLIFLGLAGGAFRQSWTGTLAVGERFDLGRYRVRYLEPRVFKTDEKMVLMAVMEVRREGRRVAVLRPQRNFHLAQRQGQSEIGLHTTLAEDLYLAVTQMDDSFEVSLRAWVNPLVVWIWIGGAVMSLGMIIILSGRPPATPRAPTRSRERRRVAVPA
ncbi:MAG: heme lyase CcmF/NrfE family subunit [Actinomycetota bacterium]